MRRFGLFPVGDGDPSPISITGDERAVLCLHGFTGTPFEVHTLAEHLGRAGCTVDAPLLAGHGGHLEDLARTRWPDWHASAEAAYQRLRGRAGGAPVALAGFSMGGLLALHLAHLHPDGVSALAVMGVPLRLPDWQRRTVRALLRLPESLSHARFAVVPKPFGSDACDAEMRRRNPSLPGFPLPALGSMLDLGDLVRAELPTVRQPLLVVHARQDHTAPLDDSFELCGSVASSLVERLWLDRSFHQVLLDPERTQVIEATSRFFQLHAGWERGRPPRREAAR